MKLVRGAGPGRRFPLPPPLSGRVKVRASLLTPGQDPGRLRPLELPPSRRTNQVGGLNDNVQAAAAAAQQRAAAIVEIGRQVDRSEAVKGRAANYRLQQLALPALRDIALNDLLKRSVDAAAFPRRPRAVRAGDGPPEGAATLTRCGHGPRHRPA